MAVDLKGLPLTFLNISLLSVMDGEFLSGHVVH
jgi:hypothetical protein